MGGNPSFRALVPRVVSPPWTDGAGEPALERWDSAVALPPFELADGSGPAVRQTAVRVCWDERALYVRFDCEDRDPWGTFSHRDDPLYEEEVVEVFLAPGESVPPSYFEFEVSPLGILFDAVVHNPRSRRDEMEVVTSWDCPGIRWAGGIVSSSGRWWAVLALPWVALHDQPALPRTWRGNFYRIERPREGHAEFSCWSPTQTSPPEFHKPERFGVLELQP